MLSFHVKFVQTDRRTTVKRYVPDFRCRGIKINIYYIPSSEILEFPSVINFDIITSDDINFHCRNLGTTFFSLGTYR